MSLAQNLSRLSRCFISGMSLIILCSLIQHAFWTFSYEARLGLVFFLLGCVLSLRASAALCSLAFLLPWFGNRPGTLQTYCFWLLLLGMHLMLSFRYRYAPSVLLSERVGRWLGCGYLVSWLSLSGVSWYELWWALRSQVPSWSDLGVLSHVLYSLLQVREDHIWYAPTSVIIFGLSWHVAEIVAIERARLGLRVLQAIAAGLVCALLVGVADYYQLVELRWLRALDPVVNPGDVQFRLQSTFGHSGWFAEYVTLAIPSALVLLALRIRLTFRVALLLFLLMLAEFVLILTFQRGGWLSYPLTLVAVWAAVYGVASIERGNSTWGESLRKSLKKILISIPLTLLCSFVLIGVLNTREGSGSEWGSGVQRYLERFKEIKKTSDRTQFLQAGTLLGLLQPIIGNGNESFAWNFEREFESSDGVYAGRLELPLHGSAHNLFAQTFAGKGLLGLFTLVGLLLCAIANAGRVIRSRTPIPRDRALVAFCVGCFAVACLIYGNVQEVFYVHSLIALFFLMFAVLTPEEVIQGRGGILRSSSLVGLLLLHLAWTWLWPTRDSYYSSQSRVDLGCYGKQESNLRWCRPRSLLWPPAGADLELSFGPELSNLPATVQVTCSEKVVFEQEIPRRGSVFRISTKLLEPCSSVGDPVRVMTRAYFIPERDLKNSEDPRVLSFRLSWVREDR